MLTYCLLFWVLFLFSLFSCLLLCCFPSFPLLITFGVSDYFACFAFFFSCSSLRVCIVSHICMHGWYLDTPHTHHIPLHDLWRPCVDLGILDSQFAPPHPCLNYVLRSYLCLCLPCFAFAGCKCIPCTHPNASPPSWVPPYPFMSAHIYVSFGGKFPGHILPGIIPC